ncbi:helicase associated domain-containing protein [Kitasatospora sp. NPDC004289]
MRKPPRPSPNPTSNTDILSSVTRITAGTGCSTGAGGDRRRVRHRAWLAALRAAAEVPGGEAGALDPERRAQLEAIDPWWAPRWPITWQRSYANARPWWLESDGRVDWAALPVETEFAGEALGRWAAAQRAAFGELDQEQQDLLGALGIAQAAVGGRGDRSRR